MRGPKRKRKARNEYRRKLREIIQDLIRLRGDHRRWSWEADWPEIPAVLEGTTRVRRADVAALREARR